MTKRIMTVAFMMVPALAVAMVIGGAAQRDLISPASGGRGGGGALPTGEKIVYDNSTTLLKFFIDGNSAEWGDGVTLAGTNRVVTNITLIIRSFDDVTANFIIRIYEGGDDFGASEPGALLWTSATFVDFPLASGTNLYDFAVPNITVPDTLTWTLEFGFVEGVGSRFMDPPTIGSSEDNVWDHNDGVWTPHQFDVGGANNFGAIINAVPPVPLMWFTNEADFVAFNAGEGKVLKGTETYEESILDTNNVDTFDDPLESDVPNAPDGFPFPEGMTGLPNLIVQSNLGGGNPTNEDPRGPNGLAALSAGLGGAVSDVVVAAQSADSLDLIFTDEKSGVGFNPISLGGAKAVKVRVYSTDNVFLGEMPSPADPSGANFIGVWSPIPIGRINIFDPGNGAEGGDNIQAWELGSPSCPADLDGDGNVGATDLLALLVNWGPCP